MITVDSVSIDNFLSIRRATIELRSLNVLVGPNGSGKTNFLRVFQFLGEVARRDLVPAIDALDGFDQLRFRAATPRARSVTLVIKARITEHSSERAPDEYHLSFLERKVTMSDRTRRVISRNEAIVLKRFKGRGRRITLSGRDMNFIDEKSASREALDKKVSVQSDSSGLSTIRKLGDEYGASQVEKLATLFEDLRLFEVDVERARRPSRSKDPSRLSADASNIAAYLKWLSDEYPDVFEDLSADVRHVLPSFVKFSFSTVGGADEAIRVDIVERNLDGVTPLGRASFGTIRSIALFAMLHDPNPPKLTCLEEVDHGLHPHALDRLVERLRDASMKTQIIVATHSPALVNRLEPEELHVFERNPESGATELVDISPDLIRKMQEKSGYGLGELWFSGTLGGGL